MRFALKVFCCTIIVIAIAMGFSGTYMINSLFVAAIGRETDQAMDENNVLRFALETIALNAPLKYGRLQDNTIEEIAEKLRTGRYIRISGEDRQVIYSFEEFDVPGTLLDTITDATQACRVIEADGRYLVHTATSVKVMSRLIYMETFKDISSVFRDREENLVIYRYVALLTLLGGAVIMSLISLWLTRPVRALSGTAISMAAGDYSVRAKRIGSDELGLLTNDFNTMADALESKISALEEAAESRERFVAAFAHELKTPLTSIVGYADLLRSSELDEDNSFMAANYIYDAGKRLERLSFRLLDIIVLKNWELEARVTPVSNIFSFIEDAFHTERSITFSLEYDSADIQVETSLITTVLINIIENAVKASDEGGRVEVSGSSAENGYRFSVRDYGCGIDPDEIKNLTQAFYMADKSRSRSRHGVGLGLTLCSEILALHGSMLKIESVPGEGTTVSFLITPQGGASNES